MANSHRLQSVHTNNKTSAPFLLFVFRISSSRRKTKKKKKKKTDLCFSLESRATVHNFSVQFATRFLGKRQMEGNKYSIWPQHTCGQIAGSSNGSTCVYAVHVDYSFDQFKSCWLTNSHTHTHTRYMWTDQIYFVIIYYPRARIARNCLCRKWNEKIATKRWPKSFHFSMHSLCALRHPFVFIPEPFVCKFR